MTNHRTPDAHALDGPSSATSDKPAPGRDGRQRGEFFQMLSWRWDVTAAKKFIQGREAEGRIDPREWSGMLHLVAIDPEHAARVDMSEPLIVITVPDSGMLIIDGWHRLYKALDTGVPELAAVILTTEEELACRIFGGESSDEDDDYEEEESGGS
ncbi:hypothetical protein ACFYUV_06630 [Nonomuraea sp. NPDC003560]|uniref:hypothetical protein n=1 Tax=Nonomuraea sp. NPDC003560 TaxID=3364341 RepID=UPI0036CE8324